MVTSVLLLAISSFSKSAAVLLFISVAKLVVNVASAAVLAVVSAVKLVAIVVSAVVALVTSLAKAVEKRL